MREREKENWEIDRERELVCEFKKQGQKRGGKKESQWEREEEDSERERERVDIKGWLKEKENCKKENRERERGGEIIC